MSTSAQPGEFGAHEAPSASDVASINLKLHLISILKLWVLNAHGTSGSEVVVSLFTPNVHTIDGGAVLCCSAHYHTSSTHTRVDTVLL